MKDNPNSQQLKELAIYLEGYLKWRGELLPLGKDHLDNLWKTVRLLQKSKM